MCKELIYIAHLYSIHEQVWVNEDCFVYNSTKSGYVKNLTTNYSVQNVLHIKTRSTVCC